MLQEALTKTYVAWPRLRDPAKAEACTRKAITTTAITWFRRKAWNNERATETLPEPGGTSGAGHADSVTHREWVWSALQALPPRQRVAIVLRYYEDYTEAQTAQAMGCAVGTVKSQVSAALKNLRGRLDSPTIDLAAITRAGDRTVRRHRIAGLAAGTAAVVGIGVVAQLLPWPEFRESTTVARSQPAVVSWAIGSEIHTGSSRASSGSTTSVTSPSARPRRTSRSTY